MRVQISSGQGPAECELAVAMLYEELRKEAGDVRLVGCTPGKKPGCMSSVVFETDRDLRCLLYTSPSPRDISGSRMPSSA